MPQSVKEFDLVHVIWAEDQGLVSLKQQRWIFYTWGRFYGYHAGEDLPTVGIEDKDFRLLGDDPDLGRLEHANWDFVVQLLLHPGFPLQERINANRCQQAEGLSPSGNAEPKAKTTAKLEMYAYADISTAHITRRDDELLKEDAAWYLDDMPHPPDRQERLMAAPKHAGYFVWVQPDAEFAAQARPGLLERGYSQAFLNLLDLARRHNAQWMVLDAEGAEYPHLPTFEW